MGDITKDKISSENIKTPSMTKDTVIIGKTYKIITDALSEFYTPHPLINLVSFINRLNAAGYKEYQTNPQFPIRFYMTMADIAIMWMMNRFDGLSKDEIKPLYITAWKFHKGHLNVSRDEDFDQMVDDANTVINEIKGLEGVKRDRIAEIYMAIMEHIEAVYMGGYIDKTDNDGKTENNSDKTDRDGKTENNADRAKNGS